MPPPRMGYVKVKVCLSEVRRRHRCLSCLIWKSPRRERYPRHPELERSRSKGGKKKLPATSKIKVCRPDPELADSPWTGPTQPPSTMSLRSKRPPLAPISLVVSGAKMACDEEYEVRMEGEGLERERGWGRSEKKGVYPRWSRATIRFFAGFTTQIRVRRSLSSKIEAINSRLEEIINNKDKYKVEDASNTSVVVWRASTTISVAPTKLDNLLQPPLVRREISRKIFDGALRNGTSHPLVISVIGQSGVGRSTLVRDVYEGMAIKNHFVVQALATLPPHSSASNILQIILRNLTEDDVTCPKNEVIKKLREKLKDKTYLVVIDGEVSTTEWKHILSALPVDNAGSRVVRMSNEMPEAPPGSYGHTFVPLDHFDKDSTIELFHQRVYREESSAKYNEDVRIGVQKYYQEDIFDITEGLPLAIVLLSGLLRTKEFPVEWRTVFEHLKPKQSKRLDSILSLCFDDLPFDLKSCFLYFAALPTNLLIEAQDLVCMWMAEGFLRAKEGMTMEKVGYRYIKELIARHLIHLEPMDEHSPGEEIVTIQSKVHAFLQLESQEANFVEIHSGNDIPSLSTARRLSLQNRMDKYAALANPMPKLRSILSNFEKEEISQEDESSKEDEPEAKKIAACLHFSENVTKSNEHIKSYVRQLLQVSEFLRVINLQGIEVGDKLPDEIGDVVHLQYLGVTSCSLSEIPSSVKRLTSLQTLDVRDTSVGKLPESFWKIKTLRHVFGHELVLPKRVGDLKHLQTLDTIKPDKFGWDSETLAKLTNLHSLLIWKLGKDHVRALCAALKRLKHLLTLKIHGAIIPSSVFTSYSLRRLEVMELDGTLDLSSEPEDVASCLPNLLILSLKNTMVSQNFLDKLGELPFLASLFLDVRSYKDERLVFSLGGFHSLRRLMVDLEDLKKVEIRESALPKLADLDILAYPEDLQVEITGKPEIIENLRLEDENLYKKIKRTSSFQRKKIKQTSMTDRAAARQ